MNNEQYDSEVRLYPDGKYRWVYEMNLYKNPTVFYDVIKTLLIGFGAAFVLLFAINLGIGEDIENILLATVGIFVFILVIAVIAYFIVVGWVYGGKYVILFEMDEHGVVHYQMGKGVKRAQVMTALGGLLGVATGNLSMTGLAVYMSGAQRIVSDFAKVRKVTAARGRHLVKVVENWYSRNHVFVESDAEYDFVLDYIQSHCPKARLD